MASRLVCKEPVYHAMAHQFLRVVEHKPVAEPNAVGPSPEPEQTSLITSPSAATRPTIGSRRWVRSRHRRGYTGPMAIPTVSRRRAGDRPSG